MGAVNVAAKQFMAKNDVAADAFNFLLYGGEPVIHPEDLSEMDPVQVDFPYKFQDGDELEGEPVEKIRDVLKALSLKTDGNTVYAILGIEAQADIHYAMPVRNMMYDALSYSNQVKQLRDMHRRSQDWKGHSGAEYLSGLYKDDLLYPVITVVVFFGPEKWDGPTSLLEMMKISDERILPMVNDYRIHLITPEGLSDADLEEFHSSLREVMKFIKYSPDRNALLDLVHSDPNYRMLDEDAALAIAKCTNIDVRFESKEGKVDMCKALDDWGAERFSAGETFGIEQGIQQGIESGVRALIRLCRNVGFMYEAAKAQIISDFSLKEDVAEGYMRKYWTA